MLQFSLDLHPPHLLVLVLVPVPARTRKRTTRTRRGNETLKRQTALESDKRDRLRNRPLRQCIKNRTSNRSPFHRRPSLMCQRRNPTHAGTQIRRLPSSLTRNLHATLLNRSTFMLQLLDMSTRPRCLRPPSSASAQRLDTAHLKEIHKIFVVLLVCITHKDQLRRPNVSTRPLELIRQMAASTGSLHAKDLSRPSARRTLRDLSRVKSRSASRNTENLAQ